MSDIKQAIKQEAERIFQGDVTIGNIANLTTQNKANLVNAINELQAEVNTLAAQVGVSVEAGLDATALAIALG